MLDVALWIDRNPAEGCATVTVLDAGSFFSQQLLNLNQAGCLSGNLVGFPLQLDGWAGSVQYPAFIRTTIDDLMLSNGTVAGSIPIGDDPGLAEAVFEAMLEGAGSVIDQFADLSRDAPGDLESACDSVSATLEVSGQGFVRNCDPVPSRWVTTEDECFGSSQVGTEVDLVQAGCSITFQPLGQGGVLFDGLLSGDGFMTLEIGSGTITDEEMVYAPNVAELPGCFLRYVPVE